MSWDNGKLTTGDTPLKKHRINGYDGSVFEYWLDKDNEGFSEWLERLNEYSEYLAPSFPAEEEEEAADHMLEPYV
jgi:hypothetical protein